jgi:hypothetical protein
MMFKITTETGAKRLTQNAKGQDMEAGKLG